MIRSHNQKSIESEEGYAFLNEGTIQNAKCGALQEEDWNEEAIKHPG